MPEEGPDLGTATLLVLFAASLLTAGVSAVLGMAGGIMLLAVMLIFLEPAVAIPIHALVQLTSNSSRTLIHARAVRRDLLLPYTLLLLPAGALTVPLVQHAPADALRLAIGVFVLVATWRRRWLLFGFDPERIPIGRRFALLGGAAGAIGPIIGATGPLIAPFFLGIGLDRFELIGTKAACQATAHLAKLLLFGLAGFAFYEYGGLMLAMAAGVLLGTWLGTRLLHHIDDARFTWLYRLALTAIALRLVWSGLVALAR
ncbi:MAG TPA: sulfite exporter TauE/SafE family protein [Deltaproteobacteria bacterium]|nr:sulfite exporter TauE/SafE family protein [Deltaproteobacteria bacterium]